MILEIFTFIIISQWTFLSTYNILSVLGYLFKPTTEKSTKKLDYMNLVTVSIANKGVAGALLDNIEHHSNKFPKLKRYIVIDEGAELTLNLQQLEKEYNFELVIVPKNFKCEAIAKGRAIEYFNRTKVNEGDWYGFIDDDNKILDDTFLYEIPKYERLGYTFANPILKPRKGDSWFSYYADWIRYLDDLCSFALFTGILGKPLIGIHGELLLVQGHTLKKVGFNRKTITEDYAFSRELHRRGYRCWQTETNVSILSPHSMQDFIKQRKRWYRGLVKDFWSARLSMRIMTGIKLLSWKVGIISSWAFVFLWWFIDMNVYLKIYTAIGMSYYIVAYGLGAWNTKGLHRKIGVLLAIPIFSVLENLAPWYYNLRKSDKNKFEVIKK